MKWYVVAFLCVLLCSEQVHSLVCFTCEKQRCNWRCLKAVKCSNQDKYCLTTVTSVGLLRRRKRISKTCSPTCPAFNLNMSFASYSTTCCQTFLCNLRGFRRGQ